MVWRKGDRVCQPTYGAGDIIDVTGGHVTIDFDDGIVRKFVLSLVELTASDAPPPQRPQPRTRAKRNAGPPDQRHER